MPSNRARGTRSVRLNDQHGMGLVEVLVASAILGISLAVMLANMSTMVVGARVADRRTGEERLVRNQIETLMAAPPTCSAPGPVSAKIDGVSYRVTVTVVPDCSSPQTHYLEYTVTAVTANDPSGGSVHLSAGRYRP